MKSAYQVLGIPGNAAMDDIHAAFEKARQYYSPARLAEVDGAVDKFNEVQVAYRILKDPDARAAHDRKLAAARAQRARVLTADDADDGDAEGGGYRRLLAIGLVLVAALFAAGLYVNHRNAEIRKQQAAAELAARQQQEREDRERREQEERAEAERARAKARAEADERRLSMEARAAANQAAAERSRQDYAALQAQRLAQAEADRREYARQADLRRAQLEAQNNIARDKQRIRELCWQNYRRPDC